MPQAPQAAPANNSQRDPSRSDNTPTGHDNSSGKV